MQLFSDLLHAANYAIDYFRSHSWHLFLLIVALYVLKSQALRLKRSWSGQRLDSSTSSSNSSSSSRLAPFRTVASTDRQDVMRRVREQQQQVLNERAKVAAAERKLKDADDKERKNTGIDKAKEKAKSAAAKQPSAGYNPMQPSSAGGGGYKAKRRNVGGGG